MEEMVGLFRNHCFLSFFLNGGLRLLQGVYEPAQRREGGGQSGEMLGTGGKLRGEIEKSTSRVLR